MTAFLNEASKTTQSLRGMDVERSEPETTERSEESTSPASEQPQRSPMDVDDDLTTNLPPI